MGAERALRLFASLFLGLSLISLLFAVLVTIGSHDLLLSLGLILPAVALMAVARTFSDYVERRSRELHRTRARDGHRLK